MFFFLANFDFVKRIRFILTLHPTITVHIQYIYTGKLYILTDEIRIQN